MTTATSEPTTMRVRAFKDLQYSGRRFRAGDVFTIDRAHFRQGQMTEVDGETPERRQGELARPSEDEEVAASPFVAAAGLRTAGTVTRERMRGIDRVRDAYRGTRRRDGSAMGMPAGTAPFDSEANVGDAPGETDSVLE
jgi:hypothetical protein